MKICFLDSAQFRSHHENFDFSQLAALGELILYEETASAEIAERVRGVDVVILNKTRVRAEDIEAFSSVRLICKAGSGVDNIDVEAARARGVAVCNLPGYGTSMVAQWAFSLLLALAGNLELYARAIPAGAWDVQFKYPIVPLRGKTLGLVGLGHIGAELATYARAFGMNVLVYRGSTIDSVPEGTTRSELLPLAARSDFVSLHCRLNAATRGMIGEAFLSAMKPSSFLINVARGALVEEEPLLRVLRERRIAGAAFDVFWKEPLNLDHPLIGLPNVLLTPHVAWASLETRQAMVQTMVDIIQQFMLGTPINVVVQH